MHRLIISIVVSDKNNHIFLADRSNNFSIIELKESSDFISKLIFRQEGKTFYPWEMFFISSEIVGG